MFRTRFELPQRFTFWLAVPVLVAIYMLGVLGGFEQTFGADDAGILESIRADVPVRYTGYLFSKSLSLLYQVNDTFPWYGWALCAGHFLSLCLLVTTLLLSGGSLLLRSSFALFYFSLYAPFLITLSYNSASILIGAHTLLCLRTFLHKAKASPVALILLGISLALAFELRNKGLVATVVFCYPIFITNFISPRAFPWRRLALAAVPALIIITMDAGLYHMQMTEEYSSYLTFNKARGHLQGYGILAANENNHELRAANGWTANDYAMLKKWFLVDEKRFNVTTLERLRKEGWPRHRDNTVERLGAVAKQHWRDLGYLLSFVGLTAILRGWKRAGISLIYVLYCVFLVALMTAALKFPGRIGGPLALAATGCLAITALAPDPRRKGGLVLPVAIGVLLLVPTVKAWAHSTGLSDWAKVRRQSFEADAATLEMVGPKGVFLFQSGPAMSWSRMSPFRHRGLGFESIRTGWLSYSPTYRAAMARLGATQPSAILPRIIDNENAFIVASPDFIPCVLVYLEEAHGLTPELVDLRSLTTGAHVYRLTRGGPGVAPGGAVKGSPDSPSA